MNPGLGRGETYCPHYHFAVTGLAAIRHDGPKMDT